MDQPTLKPRPASAQPLTFAAFAPTGASTLDQLIELIEPYTHTRPVLQEYTLGALVPDLDLLGADINDHWKLTGERAFWNGEIDKKWTVFYLAGYIDLK